MQGSRIRRYPEYREGVREGGIYETVSSSKLLDSLSTHTDQDLLIATEGYQKHRQLMREARFIRSVHTGKSFSVRSRLVHRI